jgi:hypothetical protein
VELRTAAQSLIGLGVPDPTAPTTTTASTTTTTTTLPVITPPVVVASKLTCLNPNHTLNTDLEALKIVGEVNARIVRNCPAPKQLYTSFNYSNAACKDYACNLRIENRTDSAGNGMVCLVAESLGIARNVLFQKWTTEPLESCAALPLTAGNSLPRLEFEDGTGNKSAYYVDENLKIQGGCGSSVATSATYINKILKPVDNMCLPPQCSYTAFQVPDIPGQTKCIAGFTNGSCAVSFDQGLITQLSAINPPDVRSLILNHNWYANWNADSIPVGACADWSTDVNVSYPLKLFNDGQTVQTRYGGRKFMNTSGTWTGNRISLSALASGWGGSQGRGCVDKVKGFIEHGSSDCRPCPIVPGVGPRCSPTKPPP